MGKSELLKGLNLVGKLDFAKGVAAIKRCVVDCLEGRGKLNASQLRAVLERESTDFYDTFRNYHLSEVRKILKGFVTDLFESAGRPISGGNLSTLSCVAAAYIINVAIDVISGQRSQILFFDHFRHLPCLLSETEMCKENPSFYYIIDSLKNQAF